MDADPPTKTVTDRLREDILAGRIAPGSRLIELQLTERYSVGRASIRSAILELDKEGLVLRETNRGATVRIITVREAIEVYEARAALEGLLAHHAAREATDQDRERLQALIPAMRAALESGDASRFTSLGRELHEHVRLIASHAVANDLVANLRNLSRHYPERLTAVREHADQSLAEHTAIVEAIVARDPERARTAVQSHIDSIIEMLRRESD